MNFIHECEFFSQTPVQKFINHFSDEMWLLQLPYLADTLGHLHEHNKSLHGFCTTFTLVYYKKKIFRKRNFAPLLKKQKVHKCLHFHFCVVSPVNMKFNWNPNKWQTLWELNHRLQGVISRKCDITILDHGSLFYWGHLTRFFNSKAERELIKLSCDGSL